MSSGIRPLAIAAYRTNCIVYIVNRKKVPCLMRNLGIQAIIHRKYVNRTSYEVAVSDGRIAENSLQRDFTAVEVKSG